MPIRRTTKPVVSEYKSAWEAANEIDAIKSKLRVAGNGRYAQARMKRDKRSIDRLNKLLTPHQTKKASLWQKVAIEIALRQWRSTHKVDFRIVAQKVRNQTNICTLTDLTVARFLVGYGFSKKNMTYARRKIASGHLQDSLIKTDI